MLSLSKHGTSIPSFDRLRMTGAVRLRITGAVRLRMTGAERIQDDRSG